MAARASGGRQHCLNVGEGWGRDACGGLAMACPETASWARVVIRWGGCGSFVPLSEAAWDGGCVGEREREVEVEK